MANKSVQWAFDKTKVDSSWNWFWSGQTWCLPMWEGTGTAVNDIGSLGIHASFGTGGAAPIWSSSAGDISIYFGGNDYVRPNTQIGFGTLVAQGPYTVYGVTRPTALIGNYNSLISDIQTGGGSVSLRTEPGNRWQYLQFNPDGGNGPTANTVLSNGTLYSVVCTWNSAKSMSIYLNGVLDGGPYNYNGIGAGTFVHIGKLGLNQDYFYTGDILMMGVQHSVWTQEQITQFAANPFGPITQVQSGPSRSTIRFSSATSGTPNALRPASPTSQGGILPPSYIKFK